MPDKPAAPTTVFERTTVQVSWTAPFNQGSTITGYRVYFQESDGVSFSEDLTDCNRLSVITQTCTVPVSTFRASPFQIAWGGHIYAKVVAVNAYGISAESDVGNGAQIITYPDAPLLLSEDYSQRSATSLRLTWTEGLNTGGS